MRDIAVMGRNNYGRDSVLNYGNRNVRFFFFLPSFLFRNFNGDFFPTRFELYFLESSLNSIRPIKFPRSSQNYYPGTYRINLP